MIKKLYYYSLRPTSSINKRLLIQVLDNIRKGNCISLFLFTFFSDVQQAQNLLCALIYLCVLISFRSSPPTNCFITSFSYIHNSQTVFRQLYPLFLFTFFSVVQQAQNLTYHNRLSVLCFHIHHLHLTALWNLLHTHTTLK